MRWLVVLVACACGGGEKSPPETVETPLPKPAPRGVVAYDDKDEPPPVPAVPSDAPEPDAEAEPPPRDAPANVDMKTELRGIKRALAKINAGRDPAAKRKLACELAGAIEAHAFAAKSLPDPKDLTGDTLFQYQNEVLNLWTIADDMTGHCKDNEPDGVDLDLEQMPRSFARLVQLVPRAQRP